MNNYIAYCENSNCVIKVENKLEIRYIILIENSIYMKINIIVHLINKLKHMIIYNPAKLIIYNTKTETYENCPLLANDIIKNDIIKNNIIKNNNIVNQIIPFNELEKIIDNKSYVYKILHISTDIYNNNFNSDNDGDVINRIIDKLKCEYAITLYTIIIGTNAPNLHADKLYVTNFIDACTTISKVLLELQMIKIYIGNDYNFFHIGKYLVLAQQFNQQEIDFIGKIINFKNKKFNSLTKALINKKFTFDLLLRYAKIYDPEYRINAITDLLKINDDTAIRYYICLLEYNDENNNMHIFKYLIDKIKYTKKCLTYYIENDEYHPGEIVDIDDFIRNNKTQDANSHHKYIIPLLDDIKYINIESLLKVFFYENRSCIINNTKKLSNVQYNYLNKYINKYIDMYKINDKYLLFYNVVSKNQYNYGIIFSNIIRTNVLPLYKKDIIEKLFNFNLDKRLILNYNHIIQNRTIDSKIIRNFRKNIFNSLKMESKRYVIYNMMELYYGELLELMKMIYFINTNNNVNPRPKNIYKFFDYFGLDDTKKIIEFMIQGNINEEIKLSVNNIAMYWTLYYMKYNNNNIIHINDNIKICL